MDVTDVTRFELGIVVYHKATNKKCVVISLVDENKVKVRTEDDLERDYFPQELETEKEALKEKYLCYSF